MSVVPGRGVVILWVVVMVVVPAASGAETFGDPADGPLPNVTDIRIYDVTGQDPGFRETGGQLVDSGLNTTLSIRQQDTERRYRIEFAINNTGSQDWTLEDLDAMVHDGLDPGWEVIRAWYNISQDYDGSVFAGTNVTWDTSNGGTVGVNEVMHAKYLFNITKQDDGGFDQFFEANDTSSIAGSRDEHRLEVTAVGDLSLALEEPPDDTIVKRNDDTPITATATCTGGVCGRVTMTSRYNESGTADTLLPSGSGTPFYLEQPNERECASFLADGESCTVGWTANATGPVESYHLLDANASSNASRIEETDTADSLVQINEVILMDLTFENVGFGLQQPGADNIAARGNDELAYNVTFDSDSIGVDDLYVKGSALVNEDDMSYSIGPGNLTVNDQPDPSTGVNLSRTFQSLVGGITPPANVTTFFWLDVPTGRAEGDYNGTITFKANTTV